MTAGRPAHSAQAAPASPPAALTTHRKPAPQQGEQRRPGRMTNEVFLRSVESSKQQSGGPRPSQPKPAALVATHAQSAASRPQQQQQPQPTASHAAPQTASPPSDNLEADISSVNAKKARMRQQQQQGGRLAQEQEPAQPAAAAAAFSVQQDAQLRTDAESQQQAAPLQPEQPGQPEAEPAAEAERLAGLKAEIMAGVLPDVLVVDDPAEARRVCALLLANPRSYGCDTEVADIDVTKQSPCGHGRVTCFSIYGGEDLHFGKEAVPPGGRKQTTLWVDTYFGGTDEARAVEMFEAFEPFFKAPTESGVLKVWHNYSFDRHVLANPPASIDCQGFGGDTMHMARLWDSSRKGGKTYSLASLTGDAKLMEGFQGDGADARGKISMKELFGCRNITKSGAEGKLVTLPPVEELQEAEETRAGWINYSAFDAKATLQLHDALRAQLEATPCIMDPAVCGAVRAEGFSMWQLYQRYWRPFGELLTDMEKTGVLVNRKHLKAAEMRAREEQLQLQDRFRIWATKKVKGAEQMNIGSGPQIRQLLFAGVPNSRPDKPETLELQRVFKVPNRINHVEPGKSKAKKNVDITLFGLWGENEPSPLQPEVFTPTGWPAVSTPVLRSLAGKPGAAQRELDRLEGKAGEEELPVSNDDMEDVLEVDEADEENVPTWSTDWAEIHGVGGGGAPPPPPPPAAAAPPGVGRAYEVFGDELTGRERVEAGLTACAAIDALCEVGAIDTLLSNFIVPLQEEHIATRTPSGELGRVHCSLNINTETGRLSARRPNLQNQPALEKDRYKVRQAFTAAEGNTLVVADYGQLELRLLAHMTDCRSMLTAFEAGGDFHSRTALGMYDHIKEAINRGECMLEWDGPPGSSPPVPLLKDAFASERRRAKVLNFSIAYGKTAHGLSRDWKVPVEEAQETVDRWYSDRPEVLAWQRRQQQMAEQQGYVLTMLGRRRALPDARSGRGKARGHAMRAAINTPIQGSAADVATAAMLAIHACPELRDMGWRLLLQVHDEVILEGPQETALKAKQLVVGHMERPFEGQNPLRVALAVDAKSADTWYEAK